jgi:hypothetical protein
MISGNKVDWSKSNEIYTEGQIASVAEELGIEIISDTDSVFLALCPFHRNTDTPSFAINKENGTFYCFNSACNMSGGLLKLVMQLANLTIFPAKRLIRKYEGEQKSISQQVEDLFAKKDELPSFSQDVINRMADSLWDSPALEYMHGRGFNDRTLAHFEVGYSAAKGLVVVPVHDWEGTPVGVIGRTLVGKRFENSEGLPTKRTMFNVNRAKRCGERVIVVESSMDAMLVHQAGFPYVVATCGGFFTDSAQQLLNRYFNEIIIMTDNDDPDAHRSVSCRKCENTCVGHSPGRALGEKIADTMKHKRIRWATYDYGIVYPHNAKDVGDLEQEEISKCIENAVSSAEYEMWKKDFPDLARY